MKMIHLVKKLLQNEIISFLIMSSNKSNCTCTMTCTTTSSITRNGETFERTTQIDSKTDPDGQQRTKTSITDVRIDPEGHKKVTTSSNTQVGSTPSIQ